LWPGSRWRKRSGHIEPHDLPITPGLQEDIYAFSKLDELIDLHSVPERIACRPPFGRTLSDTTESCLPRIAGGLSVALARSFKVIDPTTKNPATREWERAFQLSGLLL
jgi:hypothetical protein